VGRLQQVIAELRRRRVFRALLGWGLVSFAVLQVVEPVMHGLDLPGWTLKAAIWALAAGFPIASVLAWIFDLGPGGVSRTPAGPVDPTGASPPPPRRLGLALASLVAVSILLGAGLAVVALRTVDGQSPQAPSIAVLPFADRSPGQDQEYFSDGVAEEILNALAQVEGLKVIGRTSSFSFKGRNEDLRVIGQRLGARALLEGSVRKDGVRIRITAQLVRAADGSHLWSRTVDREFVDVFAVQSEIAQGVVEALRARLVPGPAVAPAERRVTSPEAYRRVLLGRDWCRRGEPRRTVGVLEGAVALDPGYAPGWAWLSVAVAGAGGADDTPERMAASFARARAAADRAVSLDPEIAEAYLARSNVTFWYGLDLAATGPDVDRALALSPGSAWANFARGAVLLAAGRPREALGVPGRRSPARAARGWRCAAHRVRLEATAPGRDRRPVPVASRTSRSPGEAPGGHAACAAPRGSRPRPRRGWAWASAPTD